MSIYTKLNNIDSEIDSLKNGNLTNINATGLATVGTTLSVGTALSVGTTATIGGDVTIGGDLRINGNDIKSSTGQTVVTLSSNDATFADDLTVNGNVIIGTSGKGISFANTIPDGAGATVWSELLDDYEEGSWTPFFDYSGNSAGDETYDSAGFYIKTGRHVYAQGWVKADPDAFTLLDAGGGAVRITGLPFTSILAGAGGVPATFVTAGTLLADYVANTSIAITGAVHGHVALNTTQVNVLYFNGGSPTNTYINGSAINAGSGVNGLVLSFMIHYMSQN